MFVDTDPGAVLEAIRRQNEDPEDHDLSLIDECLGLTPEERLQRLAAWVNMVDELRASSPPGRP